MSLHGIQIVNGGQTTASLHQCWLSGINSTSDERREAINQSLEDLFVPVKIIVPSLTMSPSQVAALKERVSEASNSQNAVRRSDLSANQPFQIEFSKVVSTLTTPDGPKWFYERAQGMYTAELARLKGQRADQNVFKLKFPKEKIFSKTDLALAMFSWDGRSEICCKGRENAFGEFSLEMNKKDEIVISKEEAKQMICKRMLYAQLEKAANSLKEIGVTNPRIPLTYGIAIFARYWGKRVRWDIVWGHQGWSDAFVNEMYRLLEEVGRIMLRSMNTSLITLWGRNRQCWSTLNRDFDPSKFSFDYAYEIRPLDEEVLGSC